MLITFTGVFFYAYKNTFWAEYKYINPKYDELLWLM